MGIARWLLPAVLAASVCPGQTPADLTFTLAVKDGRTSFRIGEALPLELRCQSAAPAKYQVWAVSTNRVTRMAAYDRFIVEPPEAALDPLADIFAQQGGGKFGGVPPAPVPLAGQAIAVTVYLNEWLSIRKPGRYRVTAETRRVVTAGQPEATTPIRSNTIEIEIRAPEPGWAETQLKQAVSILERADPPQPRIGQVVDFRRQQSLAEEAEQAARTLRFLETPEAALALVRFFEHGPQAAQQQLRAGLWGSPHREQVMKAMEEAVAAPDVAITYYYLGTLIELMDVERFGPTPAYTAKTPEEIQKWVREVDLPYQQRAKPVHDEAFAKLARAIPNKRGEALATSLETLVTRGPQPAPPSATKALLANLTSLPENSQSRILTMDWPRIGSPDAEPAVRAIAESASLLRDVALARLSDLNPQTARRIAIDRIRRGDVSREAYHIDRVLLDLPDKTLPELDDALAINLAQGKYGAELLFARYASPAAADKALTLPDDRLCGSPLMAYLLRVSPQTASERLARVRNLFPGRCMLLALSTNFELFMSPGLEEQAIRDLAPGTAPGLVRNAQSILEAGGSPAAKGALMDAMLRWRANAADGDFMAVDFGFASALLQGRGWVLTPEEIDRVSAACWTDNCRQTVTFARRALEQPTPISVSLIPDALLYRAGPYMLRSAGDLADKIAQFPKGTRFALPRPDSTWFGELRGREMRSMVQKAGMEIAN